MIRTGSVAGLGGFFLLLAVANVVTERFVAAAILLPLSLLAFACAWTLSPIRRHPTLR